MKQDLFPQAKKNEPIAPYTTFGLGGEARWLFETSEPAELVAAIKTAKKNKIPYIVIAGGSNVIFPNKKYNGLIVVYRKRKPVGELKLTNNKLIIQASYPLYFVVSEVIKMGYAGMEKLSGIPGSLAGAIVGNAGAYGHSISEVIDSVEIFDGKQIKTIPNNSCSFSYRHSIFKKKPWLILSVTLKFKKGKAEVLSAEAQKIIDTRNQKYDWRLKSAGSFFQNVLTKKVSKKSLSLIDKTKIIDGKIPAGYLLENIGAKEMREGGIYVSDKHGNFVLNDGTGTFSQLMKLLTKMKKLVLVKYGIKLEEEVRIMLG